MAPRGRRIGGVGLAVGAVVVLGLLAGCGGDDDGESTAEPAPFGYGSADGPSQWASLDPAYEACGTGRRQSPIDLDRSEARSAALPQIEFDYRPAELEVENNGHSLEADYPEGSSIAIAGDEYALEQFHFHAPSEHLLNGRSFPLEFHFVHQADDGELAVLGVLVREGRENPAFASLADATPGEEGESTTVGGEVDALDLLPEGAASAQRWSYRGSLTTPPCTEGVRWEVLGEPIEMSSAQIDRYTAIYDDTNRPPQPLNGRQLTVSP